MYKMIALNCFRYLGFRSLDEVDQLTIPEYNLLMQAVELKAVDDAYLIHLQAFKNFEVQATKKSGKRRRPVYDRFSKFFDYDRAVREVLHPTAKIENETNKGLSRLRDFLIRKKKEGEGNG
ncbi:hypothetical protein [Faecalicoccus pleomorphus]|uniref:hypothetical protein n=1 Tax=Faecalicoccus pleomorphus TaxID=1323 RepID=UPI001EF6DF74|nr:hypothetical protein [Faecalicoccus pleomorphus]